MGTFIAIALLAAVIYVARAERRAIRNTPPGQRPDEPTSVVTWGALYLILLLVVSLAWPDDKPPRSSTPPVPTFAPASPSAPVDAAPSPAPAAPRKQTSALAALLSGESNAESQPGDKDAALVTGSCSEVTKMFNGLSKLSELQKSEAWPNYEGKRFKWKLRLVDISESGLTGRWDCPRSDPFFFGGSDLILEYGAQDKSTLIELSKGSTYEVEGILTARRGSVVVARPVRR